MKQEIEQLRALLKEAVTDQPATERIDVAQTIIDALQEYPEVKIKTSTASKLVFTVGSLNPEVKFVEITGLGTTKNPTFKIHLNNGESGWSWNHSNTPRIGFKVPQETLRLDVVFDGKRDPKSELGGFVRNYLRGGWQRAGKVRVPGTDKEVSLTAWSQAATVTGIKERPDLKPQSRGTSTSASVYGSPTMYEVQAEGYLKNDDVSRDAIVKWLKTNKKNLVPGKHHGAMGSYTEVTLTYWNDIWLVTSYYTYID